VITRVITPRPSIVAGRTDFTWTLPMTGTPLGCSPSILNSSYTFTADVEIPEGGAEGMLITQGGRFGGWGFYVAKNKPVFTWNLLGLRVIRWAGTDALTPGKHTLVFDFKYDGLGMATLAYASFSGVGQGGTGTLKVDGKTVATETMPHTVPFLLQLDESLDIGSDTLTGVNNADYQPPFTFTGKLNKVSLHLEHPKLTAADVDKLKAAEAKAAATRE
jgi:arylsulfatase